MAKHQVEAPIDKVKDLILLAEYPGYYNMSEEGKRNAIARYVKGFLDQKVMFEYMEKTKDGGADE